MRAGAGSGAIGILVAALILVAAEIRADPGIRPGPSAPKHAAARGAEPRSAESARTPVEFWFVEANEGESAGGHAAIRIGERLYHVEHRGDGLIADRRTSRAQFEAAYRQRGNRHIEAIPLALSEIQSALLKRRLDARLYTRGQRLDELAAAQSRLDWIEHALDRGFLSLEIPGLGLFTAHPVAFASTASARGTRGAESGAGGAAGGTATNTLAAGGRACAADAEYAFGRLRAEIEARHAPGWLEAKRRAARQLTSAWSERVLLATGEPGTTSRGGVPPGAMRRLLQTAQLEAALAMLLDCPVLDARRSVDTGEVLTARQRSRWLAARAALTDDLDRLLQSERSDAGLAILLQSARWALLDRSLATGRIQLLESSREFDPAPSPLESIEGELPAAWIPRLEARAEADWQRARRDFEADRSPLEAQLNGLERAYHALRHARTHTFHASSRAGLAAAGEPTSTHLLGSHHAAAERILPWPARLSYASLTAARRDAAQRLEILQAELTGAGLRYSLWTRNCVTELIDVLESIDPIDPRAQQASAAATRLRRLVRLGFIPEVSAREIEKRRAAGPRRDLESAREQLLARARGRGRGREAERRQDGDPWWALREATTLTSRTYQPHRADSSFLLFSDGPFWARPLIGLVNLGYGLGSAAIGVPLALVDRGTSLRRGLEGALMSVPELFFFQVRQGSYRVAPPTPDLELDREPRGEDRDAAALPLRRS